ncbi:MAG: hypothetical protein ACFFE8_16135 [Candidatus Heimdallarchaeota archaeon]
MSKQKKAQTNSFPERRILYEYKPQTPYKFLDSDPTEKKESTRVRNAIKNHLRIGLREEDGRTRFALKAQEIQKLLRKHNKISITTTNIYFHLKKLEEQGVIDKVAVLKENRAKIAYYGRTAKFFINSKPVRQKYEAMFRELQAFIKKLNPSAPELNFSDLATELAKLDRQREERNASWMIPYADLLAQEKMNLSHIFDSLNFIQRIRDCSVYAPLLESIQAQLPSF